MAKKKGKNKGQQPIASRPLDPTSKRRRDNPMSPDEQRVADDFLAEYSDELIDTKKNSSKGPRRPSG